MKEAKPAQSKEELDKILDDAVDNTFAKRETVDLRVEQTKTSGNDGLGKQVEEMDEFDLLEAPIDPNDISSILKVQELKVEIAYETAFLKARAAFKLSKGIDNPMKID